LNLGSFEKSAPLPITSMASRDTRILSALDAADSIEDMGQPAFRLHELRGRRAGTWSVKVNGNWRVTFRFDHGKASAVDLGISPRSRVHVDEGSHSSWDLIKANDELELSTAEAASAMRLTRQALHFVIEGRSAVSAEMAVRLEGAFGWQRGLLAAAAGRLRSGEGKALRSH
jgi:plasmid maintenance system killer protein